MGYDKLGVIVTLVSRLGLRVYADCPARDHRERVEDHRVVLRTG